MRKLFAHTPCLQHWVAPLPYVVLSMLPTKCFDHCHGTVDIKTVDAALMYFFLYTTMTTMHLYE